MSETFVADIMIGYRVTIPKPVRDLLAITQGDKVRVTVEKVEANENKEAA